MAISFQCGECGRRYTASEQSAGKNVKCKSCGADMTVPRGGAQPPAPADLDVFGLSEMEQSAQEAEAWDELVIRGSSAKSKNKKGERARSTRNSLLSMGLLAAIGGIIVVLVVVADRVYLRLGRDEARPGPAADELAIAAPAGDAPAGRVPIARPGGQPAIPAPAGVLVAGSQPNSLPPNLPALPQPMSQFLVEQGVQFSEIILRPNETGGASLPGHSGKLWLYLPAVRHLPQSLPCVLIAPGGSNLVTGIDLEEGDRAEHLPYARAGFAVIAYDLDGKLAESDTKNDKALATASRAFLEAEAGLVNARIAIEYATRRISAIDPRRLYAAGQGSAGTLALLLAENEPRIAACVAFAPAVDLTHEHSPELQQSIAKLVPDAEQFYTRFNPRLAEGNIQCPVFLFYAEDDQRFAGPVRDLGDRLKKLRKNVTVSSVPTGGDYDSMIKVGVPRAVEWLKSLSKPAP